MPYCVNCGNHNPETNINCSTCGKSIENIDIKKTIGVWLLENVIKTRTGLILTTLFLIAIIAAFKCMSLILTSQNESDRAYLAFHSLIFINSIGFAGLLLKR